MKQSQSTTRAAMVTVLVCALLLLAPVSAIHASGPPPLPSTFTGKIQIPINPPSVGDTVEATVAGQTVAPFTTTIVKGTDGLLHYTISINGNNGDASTKNGGNYNDQVTFKINNRTVGQGVWRNDGTYLVQQLDFQPSVDHIVISPADPGVQLGESQLFTTEAFTSQGWSMGDATANSTFAIELGSGGSCTGNSCQAGNPGDWTVTATCLTKTAGTTLHVASSGQPPALPASFWGYIQMGSGAPAANTAIVITLPAKPALSFATKVVQLDGAIGYQVNVPGDDSSTSAVEGGADGDQVVFAIDGLTVATGTWKTGPTHLDFHPPQASLTTTLPVREGVAFTLDAGGTQDAGGGALSYAFDCDGDGTYEVGPQAGSTAECPAFPGTGSHSVGVRVIDDQNGVGVASLPLTIADYVPVVDLGTPTTINLDQGDTFARNGSFTDPSTGTWQATVDYGDGEGAQPLTLSDKTFRLDHRYATGGRFTLTVAVADEDGATGTASLVIAVDQPQAEAGGPYSGTAGQPVSLTGTTNCPSSHTCTVEWLANGSTIGSSAGITYTWYAAGTYTATLAVHDGSITVSDTARVVIGAAATTTALQPGWNLVSLSVVPTDTAPSAVLASVAGKYDLVYAWDGENQTWLKADNIPASPDSLTALTEKMGFWIHITGTSAVNLVNRGNIPDETAIALHAPANQTHWNLVGYPSQLDLTMAAGTIPNHSLVYAYHPLTQPDPWLIYDPTALPFANTLQSLARNWGYWVQVTADGTWTVTGH